MDIKSDLLNKHVETLMDKLVDTLKDIDWEKPHTKPSREGTPKK